MRHGIYGKIKDMFADVWPKIKRWSIMASTKQTAYGTMTFEIEIMLFLVEEIRYSYSSKFKEDGP